MTSPAAAGIDLATVDKLLSTTRAVRKRLDLDRPVSTDVVLECLRLAIQAPTGSNMQTWRWIVVTDPDVRRRIGELYRDPMLGRTLPTNLPSMPADDPQQVRMQESTAYLRERLDRVPVLVVPCIRTVGGAAGWAPSIYPAVWSFMLALRSRGLGSVMTTAHLFRREEADELLGVPEGFVQTCLIPVAYYTGEDFKPADRRPIEEVTFLDRWDNPIA
jgi:nitroreductase